MNTQTIVADRSFSIASANAHAGWAGQQFVLHVARDACVAPDSAGDRDMALHFTAGAYFCRIRGLDNEGLHIIRIYAVGDGANRKLKTAYLDARTIAALAQLGFAEVRPYADRARLAPANDRVRADAPKRPFRGVDAGIFFLGLLTLLLFVGAMGLDRISDRQRLDGLPNIVDADHSHPRARSR